MRAGSFRFVRLGAVGAGLLLAGAACGQYGSKESQGSAARTGVAAVKPMIAKAVIEPRSNSKLAGEAVFTETEGGVKVLVVVKGAPPGMHAVHVHETGDCSAPDAKSAGGHFNPDSHPHGKPDAPQHHAGDFGNMEVGPDGTGKLELTSKDITVSAGSHSVANRAIVVHEKVDDFSQPVGNAGARLGCGVIKLQ